MYNIDNEIDDLILRAGNPACIVKGDRQEPPSEMQKAADQIERLMAALDNVICERDQLIEDLIEANEENGLCVCNYCTHYYAEGEPCDECAACDDPIHFCYRGVPEVQKDNE